MKEDLHFLRAGGINKCCIPSRNWMIETKGVGRVDKKKRTRELIVFAVIVLALLAGCLLTPSGGESEPDPGGHA